MKLDLSKLSQDELYIVAEQLAQFNPRAFKPIVGLHTEYQPVMFIRFAYAWFKTIYHEGESARDELTRAIAVERKYHPEMSIRDLTVCALECSMFG